MRFNTCFLTQQVLPVIQMKHRKNHFIPNFELRSVVLISALVLGAAISAHAQSAAPMPSDSGNPAKQMSPPADSTATPAKTSVKDIDAAFVRADANKDGKLDKKEAGNMPLIAERFEQLDANADGFLSREEFGKAAGS